jgi:DNA-binding NarL/FixJ family response regulator
MPSTIDYKKIFVTLAAAHRGSIIVIGGDGHPRHIKKGASLNLRRSNRHYLLTQIAPHIENILYRTEAGTQTVDSVQLNDNASGKDRIIFFTPVSLDDGFLNRLHEYALTRREQEVALLVMRGLSNREIAEKLFICEQTVKDHLRVVFQRMHVRRRSELAARCWLPAVDDRIPPPPPNPHYSRTKGVRE